MPGRGVYGDAGGLVDDEQVLVLPRDAQARDRLGLETARATFRQFEVDLLAAGERAYLRQAGEEAVEPFAGRSARHGDPDGGGHPLVFGAVRRTRGWRSAETSATSKMATPATMNVSARLKAGQKRRSRKSVTCPRRIRSIRLARLPPISRPRATGSTGWRAPERAK